MARAGDDLYVIGEAGSGVVKVGRASDSARRLREIQTGYPRRLTLRHVEYAAGYLEPRVHRLLEGSRSLGEWFDFGDRDAVALVKDAIWNARDDHRAGVMPGSPDHERARLFMASLIESLGFDLKCAAAQREIESFVRYSIEDHRQLSLTSP